MSRNMGTHTLLCVLLLSLFYSKITLASVLRDFQVYPPVLTPGSDEYALSTGSTNQTINSSDQGSCVSTITLVDYVFANSYGQPYVGSFTPPACDFNRVTLNLTVTSAGVQFDRLGLLYLGDIEIWRTSTAEPSASGIV